MPGGWSLEWETESKITPIAPRTSNPATPQATSKVVLDFLPAGTVRCSAAAGVG
jgi:hypothetical protein